MVRFLHAADLHLDSPLRGLERYEGAPVGRIRGATRRALENLVDAAIERKVDFVLLAGDVYDGDRRDYQVVRFFNTQMLRLHKAKIPVLLIRGNHDAASEMLTQLAPPENVQEFPVDAPRTIRLEHLRVAVHGQGFATAAVTGDLAAAYPHAVAGWLNIGLLHTAAEGNANHARYAPCTLDTLLSKGYDYWALGHVHTRQCPWPKQPHICFPGNTQGRHIGETGPKGCLIVSLEAGREPVSEFLPLDVVRWQRVVVDAAGLQSPAEVAQAAAAALRQHVAAAEGRLLAARVEVTGGCPAHHQLAARGNHWQHEIRNRAALEHEEAVWLEKVLLRTEAPAAERLAEVPVGPLRELARAVAELREDEGGYLQLAHLWEPLRQKLAAELPPERVAALIPEDQERFRELLQQTEQMLAGRLRPATGGAR